MHSLNNTPNQVRTLVVLEVPGSVPGDVQRPCAIFSGLKRFQRRYDSQNTPGFQVPGWVRNIIQRVHSYAAHGPAVQEKMPLSGEFWKRTVTQNCRPALRPADTV